MTTDVKAGEQPQSLTPSIERDDLETLPSVAEARPRVALVSKSGSWRKAPIDVFLRKMWGQEEVFLDLRHSETVELEYYENGDVVAIANDEMFAFNRDEISSIEMQSDPEFNKTSAPTRAFDIPIVKETGGRLFAKRLGIPYEKLKKPNATIKALVALMAGLFVAGIAATFVYQIITSILESVYPVVDVAYPSDVTPLSGIWWSERGFHSDSRGKPQSIVLILGFGALGIAAIAGLIAGIFYGRIYRANKSEDTATFRYNRAWQWFVVMFMRDGRAIIIASAYDDLDYIRKAHAAHKNAFAAAQTKTASVAAGSSGDGFNL